jgi:hypothetical protein
MRISNIQKESEVEWSQVKQTEVKRSGAKWDEV